MMRGALLAAAPLLRGGCVWSICPTVRATRRPPLGRCVRPPRAGTLPLRAGPFAALGRGVLPGTNTGKGEPASKHDGRLRPYGRGGPRFEKRDSGKGSSDTYSKMKALQRQLEFLEIQEEYIKDEMQNLKRELVRAKEEVKRIQSVPLVIGQFLEIIDHNHGIVSSTTGSNYYVRILSTINRELLKPGASVALHRHSNAVVDVLPPEADSSISMLGADEKPNVSYNDIGGCDQQKQEIREAVELPLTHHDLYAQIGIDPPRGVLLYGPPGTGKTMLAKAVAHHTTASFIRVVGSEFVQKYLGEGPRMVRDVFRLGSRERPRRDFHRRGGCDRDEALRCADRRRPRGAAHPDGAADADGRLRPVGQRQGHHVHQPRRHARPGAAAAGPARPQDRVPAAGAPREAAHLPGPHGQHEPVRGSRPRGLRLATREDLRCGDLVHRAGGGHAGGAQQPVRGAAEGL